MVEESRLTYKATKIWILAVVLAAAVGVGAAPNCFTVVVGRTASATGAVLLAHNEDDAPPQVVNLMKVPHLVHADGEAVHLEGGGVVPEVPETAAYVWLEMPGQRSADCFMNEYGVTVVSNQCSSRIDTAELRNGGIGYWLRRLIAERAHTAREGVAIAAKLLTRFGYRDSGRTYTIADPSEAWMMAVARGNHWAALRIPDDQVAVLANVYSMDKLDPKHASSCMISPGLQAFAVGRGWFHPEAGRLLSFRDAFADPDTSAVLHSLPRWWYGLTRLSGHQYPVDGNLPFSVVPVHPIALTDLFALLGSHYENSRFARSADSPDRNPHVSPIKRICSDTTQYGLVAELRADLPPALGCVLWWAPRRPCVQPFVPIYAGIEHFPPGFAITDWRHASEEHLSGNPATIERDDAIAYFSFDDRANALDLNYDDLVPTERARKNRLQDAALAARTHFEKKIGRTLERLTPALEQQLTDFSAGWLEQLWRFNCTDPALHEKTRVGGTAPRAAPASCSGPAQ